MQFKVVKDENFCYTKQNVQQIDFEKELECENQPSFKLQPIKGKVYSKIISDKENNYVFCQGRITIDDKAYQCPCYPFAISKQHKIGVNSEILPEIPDGIIDENGEDQLKQLNNNASNQTSSPYLLKEFWETATSPMSLIIGTIVSTLVVTTNSFKSMCGGIGILFWKVISISRTALYAIVIYLCCKLSREVQETHVIQSDDQTEPATEIQMNGLPEYLH